MSRFDDDLRAAIAPMVREPLPEDTLHEALDPPSNAPHWPALASAMVAVLVLAITAGIGFSALVPSPSPSASTLPSPSTDSTDAPVASCRNVDTPVAGGDRVLVYFPCGSDMANGTRVVQVDLDAGARLEATLRALLDGPIDDELEVGMSAVVPAGSEALLSAVSVAPDGLAQVDFDPALRDINNLRTTDRGGAFVRAVRETALQFDEVTAIELRIAGSCDDFYAHFESSCQLFAKPIEHVNDCPVIPPAELPSGAPITNPRPYPGEPMVSWGSGADIVTQLAGDRDGRPELPLGRPPVLVRGYESSVVAMGDLPASQILIRWEEQGCPYAVWVGPDLTIEQALDFAGRFGPVVAQPSAPPAEPITAAVEEQGIRMTITLDRDRTSYNERVWADVTVENIGADVVHWGHSGSCVHAASVLAHPDVPLTLAYGRDDWSGDLGILKRVTVDDRDPSGFGFTPEEFVDFEGFFGCTLDFVADEVAPGEVVTYRVAWDAETPNELPARPGTYRVEATFSYQSRGELPPIDEEVEDQVVIVRVPLTIDGPEVEWLSPGEAVDAILEDDSFQAQLSNAPRGRWTQSDLTFEDGLWVMSLYLTETDRDSEVIEAIVTTVDAVSGAVTSVELVEGASPPGG